MTDLSSYTNFSLAAGSRSSDRKTSSVQSQVQKSQKSQKSGKTDRVGSADSQETLGVQPGYTDDTYGIPILELSSDSEVIGNFFRYNHTSGHTLFKLGID